MRTRALTIKDVEDVFDRKFPAAFEKAFAPAFEAAFQPAFEKAFEKAFTHHMDILLEDLREHMNTLFERFELPVHDHEKRITRLEAKIRTT